VMSGDSFYFIAPSVARNTHKALLEDDAAVVSCGCDIFHSCLMLDTDTLHP